MRSAVFVAFAATLVTSCGLLDRGSNRDTATLISQCLGVHRDAVNVQKDANGEQVVELLVDRLGRVLDPDELDRCLAEAGVPPGQLRG